MKKLLAVLLSLCLVVGMLPMMAFATDDDAQVTTNDNQNEEQQTHGGEGIDTPEEFEEAIGENNSSPIEITGNISVPKDIIITNDVTIKSAGSIDLPFTLNASSITVKANVTLQNIIIDANILVDSGKLTFSDGASVTDVSLSCYPGASIEGLEGYNKIINASGEPGRIIYTTQDASAYGDAYIEDGSGVKTVYTSLQAAFSAAKNGDVVTLCDNVSGNVEVPDGLKLVIPAGITVDGTVTGNFEDQNKPVNPPVTDPDPDPETYTVAFKVYPYWATITVTDSDGKNVTVWNNKVTLEEGKTYSYLVAAPGFNNGTGTISTAGDIKVRLSQDSTVVVAPTSHGDVSFSYLSHGWVAVYVDPNNGYYLDDLTIYRVGYGAIDYGKWDNGVYYFRMRDGQQYIVDADFAAAPSEYRVYVDSSIMHGDVSVDTVYAEEGEWVYITVDPDVGYRLYNLTVTRPSGNTVKVEHVRDNVYRFSMPGVRVTVDAEFIRTVTPFTDVRLADWFYEYVSFAYRYGLMEGINSYQFAPDATATRAMVVQILYRMSGEPAVSYGSGFTDVASNAWYADAIAWAARNNIVNGTGAATFDPNAPVTREQFATMLYRYARYRGFNTSLTANILSYYDVNQVSEYAFPGLEWACANGIVNGTSTGYLTPQGNATRAQLAAMLMRFCNEYFDL